LPAGVAWIGREKLTTVQALALPFSLCHGPETSRLHTPTNGTVLGRRESKEEKMKKKK
jgi:hypothetical protein